MKNYILYILIIFNKLLIAGANTSSIKHDEHYISIDDLSDNNMYYAFDLNKLVAIGPILVDDALLNFISEKYMCNTFVYGHQAYRALQEFILQKVLQKNESSLLDIYKIDRMLKNCKEHNLFDTEQFIQLIESIN